VNGSCVDENALLMSEVRREFTDWLEMIERQQYLNIHSLQPRYAEYHRRPHRVPLLSAKNRKWRLPFAQAHQNWTIEDWKKVAWSDESQFLLRHSDGRVRIWRNEHESMDSPCLVSMVEAAGGGVMVWGIYLWVP